MEKDKNIILTESFCHNDKIRGEAQPYKQYELMLRTISKENPPVSIRRSV